MNQKSFNIRGYDRGNKDENWQKKSLKSNAIIKKNEIVQSSIIADVWQFKGFKLAELLILGAGRYYNDDVKTLMYKIE